jgi:hypothetical protein
LLSRFDIVLYFLDFPDYQSFEFRSRRLICTSEIEDSHRITG